MKMKNMLILIGAVSLLLLTACASGPKPPKSGKGRDFSSHAPLGIVMVVSNQDINWLGERASSNKNTVGDFVRNMLNLNKEDDLVRTSSADELINEADSILRKVITDAGVFRLQDKDRTVVSVNNAAARNKSVKMPSGKIAAQGYRYLNYRNKQFAADFSREAGVNSLLYVSFELNKEMISGFMKNGKARSRVLMDAALVNASGKVLYHDQFEINSIERIEVKDGAYSENGLMDLFKEAIGEACYRFIWNFQGTGIPIS